MMSVIGANHNEMIVAFGSQLVLLYRREVRYVTGLHGKITVSRYEASMF